jgi:hypothetical protein
MTIILGRSGFLTGGFSCGPAPAIIGNSIAGAIAEGRLSLFIAWYNFCFLIPDQFQETNLYKCLNRNKLFSLP